MKFLKEILNLKNIKESIEKNALPCVISGLSDIHKAHFIYSILDQKTSPTLVVAPDEAFAEKIRKDLTSIGLNSVVYPAKDFNFYDIKGRSYEYEHQRLRAIYGMIHKEVDVVISCLDAALQYTIPKEKILEVSFWIKEGQEISIKEICTKFLKCGYEMSDQVEGVGQFSHRGGIVDFYAPSEKAPIRIEFFGDEIDTISYFDQTTQRRTNNISKIEITPTKEFIIDDAKKLSEKIKALSLKQRNKKTASNLLKESELVLENVNLQQSDKFFTLNYNRVNTLFDYLSSDSKIFICEQKRISERMKSLQNQWNEDLKLYLEDGILCPELCKFSEGEEYTCKKILEHKGIYLDIFFYNEYPTKISYSTNINAISLPVWNGSLNLLCEDISRSMTPTHKMIILAGTERTAQSLHDDLKERGFNVEFIEKEDQIQSGKIYISSGALSKGFSYPDYNFSLITHGYFNQSKPKKRTKVKNSKTIYSLSDLTCGDYVVHETHGIGIFQGIHKLDLQGIKKDYLKITYAKNDVLYVPITQLDCIDKYIGPKEDVKIKLNKLGTNDFQKSKNKVKKAVKDIAKELIKIYSARMNAPGYAFPEDTEWQKDFEAHFAYEETPDQLRCIDEIKSDMQKSAPMERLLCGDVGFGKTEVALRAAFKCVSSGKQCALLVPTTILAWQHFNTALKRFENFPIKIELLSRFRTQKQQNAILKALARGEIDFIIGTHRLVQKDVQFHDLGLVIIDEEQRFGVAQKERFKNICKNVDILTLSATPIPRTLNMAMSGIRDMSVLEEAPQNRYPVQTYVLEHSDTVINEAIRRELRRGGQVYYLYNNVAHISNVAFKIQKDIPEAKVAYAHGKMDEKELSAIWERVISGEINVLVCTTIIETGIDIPNVNTLIIESADHMGLSQLHQIRGRVGRSSRRAFAYFTFKRDKALSEISQKRLSAIREFTEFGSGFKIAMRDLELRGAGNILGSSQHGHMADIGYELYLKLLNTAVSEEKGETPESPLVDCTIDLQIDAYIEEKYIPNLNQRIDIYRRISDIRTNEDATDVLDEIIDRYGNPPKSIKGLIQIALTRSIASSFGVYEIKQKGNEILLFQNEINQDLAKLLINKFDKRVKINLTSKPHFSIQLEKNQPLLNFLQEVFTPSKTTSQK